MSANITSSRSVTSVLVVAFAVLVLAACGGYSNKKSAGGGKTTIAGLAANNHGSKDVAEKSEFDLELDDNYFDPTVLKGKPGEKLAISLENEGKAEHTFTIDSQHVDVEVGPDEKKTVTVTFPSSGTLAFYCRYHKSLGMAGGLKAESSSGSGGY